MFGFALRLVIAVPLLVALLGLSVVVLALELVSPARRDLFETFVNRG